MTGFPKMLCRVLARRTVAAADVATSQAETKVEPVHAEADAVLASHGPGPHGIRVGQVLTVHALL